MADTFVLKVLSYGVLGLSAVMLLGAWQVLISESRRQGSPRKGIIRFTLAFMTFCLALAFLSAYVQVRQMQTDQQTRQLESIERLRGIRFQLQSIHEQLCGKAFVEVGELERLADHNAPEGGTDVAKNLKYMVNGLLAAVEQAWQQTGPSSNEHLSSCRDR